MLGDVSCSSLHAVVGESVTGSQTRTNEANKKSPNDGALMSYGSSSRSCLVLNPGVTRACAYVGFVPVTTRTGGKMKKCGED